MAYILWYVSENIRQKFKKFTSYNAAVLYKKIMIKKLQEKSPDKYYLVDFYIIQDDDPVYEIWWEYEDGREDISNCGEFYDKDSLNRAIMNEKKFFLKLYIDGIIDEIIKVKFKEYFYQSDYPNSEDIEI